MEKDKLKMAKKPHQVSKDNLTLTVVETGKLANKSQQAAASKDDISLTKVETGKLKMAKKPHYASKDNISLTMGDTGTLKMAPDTHISRKNIGVQCDLILLNITGTFLGFIRFGYFLAAFFVLTIHIAFPPIVFSSTSAETNIWIKSVAGVLGYLRLFFEIMASLVVAGDAVVTWSTLNGALRSSSTFMAQFALPHWLTRTLLVLIVCSSHSAPAEEYIANMWSPYLASAYSFVPLVSLACGLLIVVIWRVPGFSEHAWLAYRYRDIPEDEDCVDNWGPLLKVDQSKRLAHDRSTRTLKGLCLLPVCLALAMNVARLCSGSVDALSPQENVGRMKFWQEIRETSLQIVLCSVLLAFIIYQIKKSHKDRMPIPIKVCLLYVVISVMACVQVLTSRTWLIVCLYMVCFAAMIIPMFAFSVMQPLRDNKDIVTARVTWFAQFLKNFTHLGKWLRIGEVGAVILALAGLMFATLSLPLPWFRIDFEQDLKMDEFLDTIRTFNESISKATKELEDFAALTKSKFQKLSCEELAGALAGAAVASIIPGAGQAIKQGLRVAKYMRALGQKMVHYKSLFSKLIVLMRKVNGFVDVVKKPLLVGVTLENMGMLMFLLPVIITGTIVIFFAFWPRKLRSGNWLQGKKKCCIVLGTASIHLAFNVVGLLLFEWWGPMLATIADGLPLTKAHLVRETGWRLVEAGFGCAIGASFIFFLQAFFSIFRPEPEDVPVVPLNRYKTPPTTPTTPTFRKLRENNHFGSTPTLFLKNKQDVSISASSSKLAKYSASCSKLDQVTSSMEFNAKMRWKMFRATMMDTAPPRAWCLSLILTLVVLGLSLESVLQKWLTFDPIMKPKWAKILGQLDSQTRDTDIIRNELDESSSDCLFDKIPDLRDYIKTIISPEIKQQWRDLIEQLNLPELNLQLIDPSFLINIPGMFLSLVFTIPNFVCCGLVVAGFVTSFSVRASYYFPTQEALSWISKIALFVLFGILNTLIFIVKIFDGTHLPIYDLQVQFHRGFVYAVVATILVLTIWILLMVEILAPPVYGVKKTKPECPALEDPSTIKRKKRKRHQTS